MYNIFILFLERMIIKILTLRIDEKKETNTAHSPHRWEAKLTTWLVGSRSDSDSFA
jgi:hypothetical protein